MGNELAEVGEFDGRFFHDFVLRQLQDWPSPTA